MNSVLKHIKLFYFSRVTKWHFKVKSYCLKALHQVKGKLPVILFCWESELAFPPLTSFPTRKRTFTVTTYFLYWIWYRELLKTFSNSKCVIFILFSYPFVLQNFLKYPQVFGGDFLLQKPFWFFSDRVCWSMFSWIQWILSFITDSARWIPGKEARLTFLLFLGFPSEPIPYL